MFKNSWFLSGIIPVLLFVGLVIIGGLTGHFSALFAIGGLIFLLNAFVHEHGLRLHLTLMVLGLLIPVFGMSYIANLLGVWHPGIGVAAFVMLNIVFVIGYAYWILYLRNYVDVNDGVYIVVAIAVIALMLMREAMGLVQCETNATLPECQVLKVFVTTPEKGINLYLLIGTTIALVGGAFGLARSLYRKFK